MVDLWPMTALLPSAHDPFEVAAERILDAVAEPSVLVAYSMGARLAMHALLRAPEKFHAAILVSGNPGLTADQERPPRLRSDREWAERFRHEPWDTVLTAWNSQSVLASASTTSLWREESEFQREALALALEYWSLARQRDLRPQLRRLGLPLHFLTGANDRKFSAMTRDLDFGRHREFQNAGHRLPWDQPQAFARVLSDLSQNEP